MEIQEMIDVMLAFKNGACIQSREKGSSEWRDIDSSMWNWQTFEYRVKPKPTTIDCKKMMERIKKNGNWVICAEGDGTSVCFEAVTGIWADALQISGDYVLIDAARKYKFVETGEYLIED